MRTASAHRQGKSIYLINLSIALRLRFTQTGALKDLDEAIRLCREAVDPAASGPGRSDAVFNLAGALQLRFQRTGALEDIDEAVQLGREDVKATAVSRIDRASSLSNLSISLRTRFVRTKALEDLDEAIRLGRAAVRATDANHAHAAWPNIQCRLVSAYPLRPHQVTRGCEQRDQFHAPRSSMLPG